ncbi:MAG: hypothetical protein ACJ8AW_49060 [Rhodopila sp.]
MALPTPRDYVDIHGVWADCVHCHHSTRLNLQALIDAGYDNTPLVQLPLRCSACGERGHRIVVMSRA